MTEQVPPREVVRQPIHIEQAQPEDAEAIFDVQRRTWLATYPNDAFGITYEDIRKRVEGEHGERVQKNVQRWKKSIELSGGTQAIFVVRENGHVVGFVAPGTWNQQCRVGALYVAPEAQGRGIGAALLAKAIKWHGHDKDIFLRVAPYNQNAINFYRSHGFKETDNPVEDDHTPPIPEIEMVLSAATSTSL